MVVSLLRSFESSGWGQVSWCGHLKPNQLPQPLQHCVKGQACLHVPLVPSPSATLSQKLGTRMLFTINCLCWISKKHSKLLIPLPRWPWRATVGDDEEVVCKCDCISAALPSSGRIPPSVCMPVGSEDPSSGSVEQGVQCWGGGVCIIHISGLFVTTGYFQSHCLERRATDTYLVWPCSDLKYRGTLTWTWPLG